MNAQSAITPDSATELQHWIVGDEPTVLSEIYRPDVNLSSWRRQPAPEVLEYAEYLVSHDTFSSKSAVLEAEAVTGWLQQALPEHPARDAFIDDIALLTDMFGYLFELPRVAVRLHSLKQAMCPRFHVDKVPCRLVTTYVGNPTEWLENHYVDRCRLGAGSAGKPDESSGLITEGAAVSVVDPQSVVLLKGEGWWENEGRGLVHRSPAASADAPRLFLSFDFAD